jgi:hypothetical protein
VVFDKTGFVVNNINGERNFLLFVLFFFLFSGLYSFLFLAGRGVIRCCLPAAVVARLSGRRGVAHA